jgi:hypothetical protein
MSFSDHFKAKIGADTAQLEQSVNKANKKVKKFSTDIKGMFGQFLAFGAVTTFVTKLTEMTSGLQETSDKLGVSTDFLQKFRYAAEQSGVKLSEAEMAIQRFLRRAGTANSEGGDQLKKVFDDLGVSLTEANGTVKNGEKLFVEFADAIGKVKDPNEKLTKSFALLDSEGVNLLKMIKDGGDSFRELSKEAEDLGLVLDNKTINSVKDTEAELRKTKAGFVALGAKVLPVVLKALQLSVNGWSALHGACKLLNVEIQLFAKTVAKEVTDAFTKFDAHLDLLVEKAKAFAVRINPFASDEDVAKAEARVERYARYAESVDKRTSKSFAENRKEILKADKDLTEERKGAIKQIQKANSENKKILEGTTTAQRTQNTVLSEANTILEKAKETRTSINTKITEALERIQALKRGGEEELAQTINRQKAEREIIKLIKDGKMTREEAEQQVNKILALEKEEKDLLKQIKDEANEIKLIEQERAENKKIIENLIKEKELQLQLKAIDVAINNARNAGLDKEVQILNQKRIQLQVAGLNVAEADKEVKKLQEQLDLVDQKRDKMNANLKVLELQAQGRDKEAEQLKAQLEIEEKIKDIADQLNITKREAKDIVDKEFQLNNEIKKAKIDQQIKDKQMNEARELAQKNIHDGVDREEKARIRMAKKIVRAEENIMNLKDDQNQRAKDAVAHWENVKTRNLKLFLDDATKQDLEELQAQRTALGDQFDVHKLALDEALKQQQAEEALAHANNVAEEQKLKDLKAQVLEAEKEVIEEAKTEFEGVGKKAKQGIEDAGEEIGDQIETLDKGLKSNNENLVSQIQMLANEIAKIAPAISAISFPSYPSVPAPASTIVKVDIDTSSISQESTQLSINTKLDGFFVNQ